MQFIQGKSINRTAEASILLATLHPIAGPATVNMK